MTLLGAILAGGAARRFGSDKAVAEWRGRTLVAHAADALAPFVQDKVLVGREQEMDGLHVLRDHPEPGLGPLGGLCAALVFGRAHGHRAVMSVACDMPIIPEAILATLVAEPRAAHVDDAPVLGIWPTDLAEPLARFLTESADRSMRAWGRSVDARVIQVEGSIANINYPDDLITLENGRD